MSKKNKGDGGGEKKTVSVTAVLKVDMHCDGCASKIVKRVRAFQGVETVKAESDTGKLTVTGDVDPAKLREQLEVKIKKKVELVSPQPNKEKEKDDNNNNKDSKDKNTSNEDKNKEKNTEEKKPKEAQVTTAVLKLDFHCQGCIEKIQKTVTKTKGVSGISMDNEKQLVTVKGTMDVKKLVESLTEKLKRNVEIVQPAKKDKEKENGNAKENESGGNKKGGGGGGKDHAGNKGGEGVNTMEYVAAQPADGSVYVSGGDGDTIQYDAPQLFSDDNPNACVVM
ncbi:hypothetical protein N665_3663s0005 [Sinapis alba]|nr:hypothetical protein N665_3663s0005 [Sinapis alba]